MVGDSGDSQSGNPGVGGLVAHELASRVRRLGMFVVSQRFGASPSQIYDEKFYDGYVSPQQESTAPAVAEIPSHFLRDLAAHFEDPAIEGLAPLVVVAGEEPAGAYTQRLYRFRGDWRSRERIRVRHVIGACMAFRLRLVRNLGGFDALMGRLNPSAAAEDGEFCGRWLRAGHQLWLAPAVGAIHVGNLPGGCEMRQMPGSEAARQQQRSLAFQVLKEERSFERISLRAWLRILRGTVLRRDVLQQRPSAWLRAYRGMLHSVNDVRTFWRERSCSSIAERGDLQRK